MNNIVLVTSGEPAGIGPDICLDLANIPTTNYLIVVLGDAKLLRIRAKILHKNINIIPLYSIDELIKLKKLTIDTSNLIPNKTLYVLHIECKIIDTIGVLNVENVNYVLNMLNLAINLCKQNISKYIVTAPISKEIINKANIKFIGHTEFFADAFNCKKVVMMLANQFMKVALVTTHIPLKDVYMHITKENLESTLDVIIKHYNQIGRLNYKIAVCGLNPHAGEGGFLGREELDIINPVIATYQQKGFNVSGSYPADTIFTRVKDFDVILAMYHDQGLPVLKYAGFNDGVNITLGLPITRISVDHGIALDIAGTGLANSKSIVSAVRMLP